MIIQYYTTMVESWIILHHHGRIMDNTRDLAPIAKRSNEN
jgi:hypothetical protein